MAFCPNCGTPNTDQADKCVSCSFELAPKKAKFKGTMMMPGAQLPSAPPPAGQAPPGPAPSAPPPDAAGQAPTGKNLGFAKTIVGAGLPPAGAFGTPPGTSSAPPRPNPGFASTEAAIPPAAPPAAGSAFGSNPPQGGVSNTGGFGGGAAAAPPSGGGFSNTGGGFGNTGGGFGNTGGGFGNTGGGFGSTGGFGNTGGFSNTGGFGDSIAPPKNNTAKIIGIGCAALLALSCLASILLYSMVKDQVNSIMGGSAAKEGAALEWRGSLATALVQVSALCQTDCASAGVYFHPDVQAALIEEAKQLTPARATKLADPTRSEARMLDSTEDSAIAQKLQLDASQCVRVAAGAAKVIGCSVPTPGGQPNLRIVHMQGMSSL